MQELELTFHIVMCQLSRLGLFVSGSGFEIPLQPGRKRRSNLSGSRLVLIPGQEMPRAFYNYLFPLTPLGWGCGRFC
jgi:hypothetical protein